MSDFYGDMAAMVTELLDPKSLGQSGVVLIRRVWLPGAQEWLPAVPSDRSETLRAAASTPKEDMVDGEAVLSGDVEVTSAVPTTLDWRIGTADKAELFMVINGATRKVITSFQIPRAGTPVAIRYLVR